LNVCYIPNSAIFHLGHIMTSPHQWYNVTVSILASSVVDHGSLIGLALILATMFVSTFKMAIIIIIVLFLSIFIWQVYINITSKKILNIHTHTIQIQDNNWYTYKYSIGTSVCLCTGTRPVGKTKNSKCIYIKQCESSCQLNSF
jgi:hypothetical protein